jgi:hypothetical protein
MHHQLTMQTISSITDIALPESSLEWPHELVTDAIVLAEMLPKPIITRERQARWRQNPALAAAGWKEPERSIAKRWVCGSD